ncbi:hypothetical protein BBJ28_00008721 [Nothophytophthora sp. Chile5]|nr:hypothetical protein BBJ28_00008721 [Nothophytophthora sp. Chile5]
MAGSRSSARSRVSARPHSRAKKAGRADPPRHAVVLVLGDVGRSPRMQYHAVSLAQLSPNLLVTLLGFAGERCVPAVYAHRNLQLRTFSPVTQRLPRVLKALVQLVQLLWLLLVAVGPVDLVLLQNPPTYVAGVIPTFVVAWLCCRLKGARFVIDWHNLGFSILALSLGASHPFVKLATWIERVFGRKADANLCVTQAMQTWLQQTWQIRATVLHDKPPLAFKPTSLELQHELFQRVGGQLAHCNDLVTWGQNPANVEETLLTRKTRGLGGKKTKRTVLPRENRPAMIISSTSWTADEDFGVLLAALELLDRRTSTLSSAEFPNLLVVVTGKGPQKEMYLEKIRQLAFQRIRIATMWLEAGDYPLVLGSADLGVCLHTSSSGLDLPMKVLDMFGCGLPVCAVGFKCLDELVQHDRNGLVFETPQQLATQLFDLLEGFPADTAQLNRLRASLKSVEVRARAGRRLLLARAHLDALLASMNSVALARELDPRGGAALQEAAAASLATWLHIQPGFAKTQKNGSKAASQKPKKPNAAAPKPKKKQQKKSPHQQQSVKKTVVVPVSKAAVRPHSSWL